MIRKCLPPTTSNNDLGGRPLTHHGSTANKALRCLPATPIESATPVKTSFVVQHGWIAALIVIAGTLWSVSVSAGDTKSGFMPTPNTMIELTTPATSTKLAVPIQATSEATMSGKKDQQENEHTDPPQDTTKSIVVEVKEPSQQRIKLLSYSAFYDHTGKNLQKELIENVWVLVSDPVIPERGTKPLHYNPRIAKHGKIWVYRALIDPHTLDIIDAGWILVSGKTPRH